MANPRSKFSKSRKNKRRANWKLDVPKMAECPQCHQPKLPHHVCPECGYYKDREVISK